jgi:SARP family transcriptional regulator, regulator of embCAB operon
MNTRSLRILIVDDSPKVRQNLAAVLDLAGRNAGVRIEIAGEGGDGVEAIALAEALRPDVVLLDLEMPALDGFEAARRIKAGAHPPKVVILSVHGGPGERERARAAGADEFVVKGAPYPTLVNAILGKDGQSNPFDLIKGETK